MHQLVATRVNHTHKESVLEAHISIKLLLLRAGKEGLYFRLELINLHVEVVDAARQPLPYLFLLPLLGVDL